MLISKNLHQSLEQMRVDKSASQFVGHAVHAGFRYPQGKRVNAAPSDYWRINDRHAQRDLRLLRVWHCSWSIDDAISSFNEFVESEMVSASNGLRILHNASSKVDMLFESESNPDRLTLANMVAHPKPIAG
jgi:hypothetical protein